ncbi:MAG: PspA/IM30 family protein [Pseudomonadota bacterium]
MFETLRTLFRARAAEAEQSVIRANGTTLLAQHLRDAEADLAAARRTLAGLIARMKAEDRRIEALTADIARRETSARSALSMGQRPLAEDIAARIASMEDERSRSEETRTEVDRRIGELRDLIREGETRTALVAAELRAARAGAASQAARAEIGPVPGGALGKAEALMEQLREARATSDDTYAALAGLEHKDDLDSRIEDAGIETERTARIDAVLTRLTIQTPNTDSTGDKQ